MKVMGYLLEWAVDAWLHQGKPRQGCEAPQGQTSGLQPWSEDDVIAFYRKHGPETQAMLAMSFYCSPACAVATSGRSGRSTSRTMSSS